MELNQVQSGVGFWKLIWKYWYVVISIIILLPTIILIVQDPAQGFLKFGHKLINADNQINNLVDNLRNNPDSVIGMKKPVTGDYYFIVYFLRIMYFVVWELLTSIWILFFPMVVIYYIVGLFNHGIVMKNIFISFMIFLLFLLVVNCIFIFIDNSLKIPEGYNTFQSFGYVFVHILPFNGVANMLNYAWGLIR